MTKKWKIAESEIVGQKNDDIRSVSFCPTVLNDHQQNATRQK
jgi:hypothetical protein